MSSNKSNKSNTNTSEQRNFGPLPDEELLTIPMIKVMMSARNRQIEVCKFGFAYSVAEEILRERNKKKANPEPVEIVELLITKCRQKLPTQVPIEYLAALYTFRFNQEQLEMLRTILSRVTSE